MLPGAGGAAVTNQSLMGNRVGKIGNSKVSDHRDIV